MIKIFVIVQFIIVSFFVGAAVGVAGTIAVYNNTNFMNKLMLPTNYE